MESKRFDQEPVLHNSSITPHRFCSSCVRLFGLALVVMGLSLFPPPCAAETLSEAQELFRTGDYAKVAEVAGLEIAEGSRSEEWSLLKLESELILGRYKLAAQTLQEAKEAFPFSIRLLWLERSVRRFNGESAKAKEVLAEIGTKIERSNWRYRDPESLLVIGQFFLAIGADAKQVRLNVFKQIQQAAPRFPGAFIAGAELALSKNDYALAAESFRSAFKLDENDPRILSGLARAFEPSDSKEMQKFLNRALEINPNHIPSLLLFAEEHLQAERYDETEKLLQHVLKVNPLQPQAWAIRAVLAHLENDAPKEMFCRQQALSQWIDNPQIDYLIGKLLSQKYRFAEGADAQQRALAFDADFLPAKMQLANDLLRLGKEEAGWKLAEEVFEADNYNVVAHNLTTLQAQMQKFRTLESDGFLVRMDAREAEIYGPRVLAVLREAKQVLCEKYNVKLNETIAVEIFPRQQDFAIRTFGLPGGAGFLGVCFGSVITMNSPASQGSSPSNWEAVLWHEFCHVVTLTKTRNKMPRWLSEGISVYEERLKNRSWGQSISPSYRKMILGDDLTPVSRLSGAFLQPPSAEHLQFAYYESSLVVEYLVDEFGIEALLAILDDLETGLQINDAITRHAAPLEEIDAGFEKFIRGRANEFAAGADFNDEDLPKRANSSEWKQWLSEHPDNFWGLQQYAMSLIREEQWETARQPIERLRELAPEFAGSGSPLLMEAKVSRELGETSRELEVLEQLAELSSDEVDVYRRLIELHSEREDWESVIVNANRILAVNPLTPEPHRVLAMAGEHAGDRDASIRGLQTLSLMDPFDPADVHFRAAKLLNQAGRLEEARKQVLLALEEAPRYREAHELLLSVIEQSHQPRLPDPPPLPEEIE